MAKKGKGADGTPHKGVTRRDFIHVLSGGVGAVAAGAVVWPLVDQMNPSADILALSTTEVDLSQVEVGQSITVIWRKQPVFIRHRTAAEIAEAEAVLLSDLKDPETDAQRVERPEWLIMVGICTHLGCIPLGERGDFDGWFCPCHGSHYDTSGRIRKGPAPKNLLVPDYVFDGDDKVLIGVSEV
ncbi:MAG: ubiquinol-cytochrome c reductase iron-sulfur subunit [Sphingomonadales bacterium]